MGAVKSSIPKTQSDIDKVVDDLKDKIKVKKDDLKSEKGNELRNAKSIASLESALDDVKHAKQVLEGYKKI